jgi:hypothetical protein
MGCLALDSTYRGSRSQEQGLWRRELCRRFFHHSYANAVFPTVGEGGFIVGAALGKGRVYVHGRLVGNTTMTQVSGGFQAGGKAYSQIIFFEDKRSLDEFESGTLNSRQPRAPLRSRHPSMPARARAAQRPGQAWGLTMPRR